MLGEDLKDMECCAGNKPTRVHRHASSILTVHGFDIRVRGVGGIISRLDAAMGLKFQNRNASNNQGLWIDSWSSGMTA